jgi:hypothetical protein
MTDPELQKQVSIQLNYQLNAKIWNGAWHQMKRAANYTVGDSIWNQVLTKIWWPIRGDGKFDWPGNTGLRRHPGHLVSSGFLIKNTN